MAGIGFKLRAYTADGTLSGLVKGYFSAAFISTGPWIITVITLMITSGMVASMGVELTTFKVMMVYTYAFSLILTGCFWYVVTRYLADRLYAGDTEHHLPAFVGVCLFSIPIEAVVAIAFYATTPIPVVQRTVGVVLFILVSTIWMVMIFVGAVKAHMHCVLAFGLGALTTFVSVLMWSMRMGELGYMLGYCAGQAVTLFMLIAVLTREFEMKQAWDFGFLPYILRFPSLALAGVTFYLGAWVDKFVFWMSPLGTSTSGFRTFPDYDMAGFVGQLTIIPGMALFFLHTETDFYEGYRAFYGGILTKVSFPELVRRKAMMVRALVSGAADLLKVQGLATFIVVVQAPAIFYFLYLSDHGWHLLRVATLAAFAQMLFLFVNIVMLYYEAYFQAFLTSLIFLVSNVVFTLVTLRLGEWAHGLGLFFASLLALAVSVWVLYRLIVDLEYITFTGQPMPGQQTFDPSLLAGPETFGQYIIKDGVAQVPLEGMK